MKHERHGTYHYCIQCDYFARKSNTLSMHYALKHSDYSPHQCKSCPKSFKTKSQLNHHVLSNHTDSMIPCKHPMCNESFKSQVNYRIHWIRKHENIHDFMKKTRSEWKCLTCGKVQAKNALTYHVTQCSPCSPFSSEGKSIQELVDQPDIDLFLEPEKPVFCLPSITNPETELPINVMDVMLMGNEHDINWDSLLNM